MYVVLQNKPTENSSYLIHVGDCWHSGSCHFSLHCVVPQSTIQWMLFLWDLLFKTEPRYTLTLQAWPVVTSHCLNRVNFLTLRFSSAWF